MRFQRAPLCVPARAEQSVFAYSEGVWISKADILAFDELLKKAQALFPLKSVDGVLPLDACILAMELAIFEELKNVELSNLPKEPEKGRFMPFGDSGYTYFEPEEIARFRELGLRVDDTEPTYEPFED